MNRQTVLLVFFSLVLMVSVLAFSFLLLIPKGKEYRSLRLESKKEFQKLETAQREYDQTNARLQALEGENRPLIAAFATPFNPERFTRLYKKEFDNLYLTEITTFETNGSFKTYEVNATSKITSPWSFYTFLEKVNKSEWIIGINFPIHFERDGEKIRSSFTMRVYNHETPQK
jgi:hypothetical protein